MAKISADQKKALEAAGYTVKGDTVSSGKGTVGGYNSNGKLFSGSKVVSQILKQAPTTSSKAPTTSSKAPTTSSKAPTTSSKAPTAAQATPAPKSKARASVAPPTKPVKVSEPKAKGAPILPVKTTKLAAPKPVSYPTRPVNPTPAKVRLQQKHTQVTSESLAKPGMNFTDWKRQYAGRQFAPGEALKLYGEYKRNSSK